MSNLTNSLRLQFLIFLTTSSLILSGQNCNLDAPNIYLDFEICHAYLNGTHADYSEFIATNNPNESCGTIELVGGHPYRNNPTVNSHSCTPGVNNSTAMCISSLDSCIYLPGHDKSLIFDLLIQPTSNGVESLDSISFFALAPENFQFIDGISGPNNYPTKFGIRVLKNGVEIYSQSNIDTPQSWTQIGFSFSDVSEATTNSPSLFTIEILPYCLAGQDSNVSAFDIDEVEIFSGCNGQSLSNLNAGQIIIPETSVLCLTDSSSFQFENPTASGENLFWILTDLSQNVLLVSDSNSIDLTSLLSNDYLIYTLSNELDTITFNGSQNLNNLSGCFSLSTPLSITISNPQGGTLSLDSGEDKITILAGLTGDETFTTSVLNAVGSSFQYVIVDEEGLICHIQSTNEFSFLGYDLGIYAIYYLSSFEDLSTISIGQSFDTLQGCISFSNALIVEIINCLREDLNDNGVVENNDFLLFTNFLNNPCASPCRPDFNDDGIVDNADFLDFVTKFNEECN